MKLFRQMVRGCGELPHVGEHPGTTLIFLFLLLGAIAGRHGGWAGMAGGAAVMALVFGPMYLYGAYDRANLSDQLKSRQKDET